MSIYDLVEVFSLDFEKKYTEGEDYEVDYENDKIRRIPSGLIPNGAQVVVRYRKGIAGDILNALKTRGEAVLRPVCALIKLLPEPEADMLVDGIDLSNNATRVEFRQSLMGIPDELELIISDPGLYYEVDPSQDNIIGLSIGEVDSSGEPSYIECFRGLVVERDFVTSPEGAHALRILAKDFSITLDSPRASAMGRTWHPRLRREVFKNGVLISDDFRKIRSAELYDSIDFDDIVEMHFAKEYPNAHQIIRDCFNQARSSYLTHLVIDCLDFPVVFFDGRDKTPGAIIRKIASLAGASVHAEGTTLIISERGFPDSFKTEWIYETIGLLDESERNKGDSSFTAVQIFGHSETERLPTRSVYLPPTDFTQPGWYRVIDQKGTIEPSGEIRSDEMPQPAELRFQLDGELYDPSSIRVLGGELASRPDVEIVNGKRVLNITVLIPWNVEDKAGECPYIEDEFGNRLFRIQGRVFDAIPSINGEKLPIPHASVCRERLDGEKAGESFSISANHEGYYCFEAVEIGKYKIIASSPGYLDNYSDDDPANDEVRDLHEELAKYENEIKKGRYEKLSTDYHVIVWARARIDMGPLADLRVSQVLLEVRLDSTRKGETLSYAPAVRDDRITTEVLAKRIGKIILFESKQGVPNITLKLPLNKMLRAGDGVRLKGEPIGSGTRFQITELRKVIDMAKNEAVDIVSSSASRVAREYVRSLAEDPLDTRVGIIVSTYRNELGGRVYDVASDGKILYNLKAAPILGELAVGETVQVSKVSTGALSYLIVARSTNLFGKERICYV